MYMYYLLYLHVHIWYTAYPSGYVTTNDKLITEIECWTVNEILNMQLIEIGSCNVVISSYKESQNNVIFI